MKNNFNNFNNSNDFNDSAASSSGVCFDRTKSKFKAYADMFGVRVNLGSFPTPTEALNAVSSFKNAISSSPQPLTAFLTSHFNLSTPSALNLIYNSAKIYPDSNLGMKFPNFVISQLKNNNDSDSSHPWVNSLPSPLSLIVFGIYPISKVRSLFHLRYDDVLSLFRSFFV